VFDFDFSIQIEGHMSGFNLILSVASDVPEISDYNGKYNAFAVITAKKISLIRKKAYQGSR